MKPIVCIAGPTASGKSALAVRLAKAVGGEVINADSMQVYSDISVLSARPAPDEMGGVPHHLFGHISGDQRYSTGEWVRQVQPIILDCLARGQVPILTGGTGLYFKALTEGIADIPHVETAANQAAADCLAAQGISGLRAQCEAVDPVATGKVLGDDPQRLQRIYAVFAQTGTPLSQWQSATRPIIPERLCRFAVVLPPREALYAKINARFDQMVELGGLEEARRVQVMGYDKALPMMKAIGVRQLLQYLNQEVSYEDAIDLSKRDSRRLAKRQMTWFRNQTPDWPVLENADDLAAFIESLIGLDLAD